MKIWNLVPGADAGQVKITLYGVIGDDWFGPPVEAEIAAQLAANRDAHAIVHINSEGGDMFCGIAIRSMLAAHPGGVTCIVEGIAASAASIIAMAGKAVMCRGAMLMIHNPWACVAGDAADMRTAADMLDKAQAGLIAIYEAKTKKSPADLKTLLDAETWMTADEAIAAGFADEMSDAPLAVEARSDAVLLNQIAFPRATMPARILAMATVPAPVVEKPASILAIVPPLAPLTRTEIENRAADVVAALVAEGHAAGIAAERARLQAIDELDIAGECPDLVALAKYGDVKGENTSDAPALAMAALKARKGAGAELLAARRAESAPIARVTPGVIENSHAAEEAASVAAIVRGADARRGGTPR